MWIVFAVLARIFWAMTNAVDQVLARAHPRHGALAGLGIELVGRLPLAVAGYFIFGPFPYQPNLVFYTFCGAMSATAGLLPYYMALRKEHACDVTPYLELTPVFLIAFAYFFKGETLTPTQLAGATLVIVSGFLFSWDFERSHFKTRIFAILAVASLFFSLYQYCVSQAVSYGTIAAASCGYYFASSLFGFIIFATMKDVRKTVVEMLVETRGRTFFLGLATNIFSLVAIVVLLISFRLAPTIGHVAGLSGSQPIFSFLLAIPLAKIFPKHFSKIIFDRETIAKMSLVLFIALGIYLLAAT